MLLAAGLTHASAQPLASSNFDAGLEGWTVVNWDGSGTPAIPSWHDTGGFPGGYIRGWDMHGDGFWLAPPTFAGDWSSAYGGSLSYDAFTTYNNWVMNDVYIVGTNGVTLSFRCSNNPASSWTHFTVPLAAGAGWQYGLHYDTIGPAATEEQIRAVLAQVASLRIREEFAYGSDDSGLDNVVLMAGNNPPRPRFNRCWQEAGLIALTLETLEPGRSYLIEQKPSAGGVEPWQPALDFVATNSTQLLFLPATNSASFYRASRL